jgi:hypothetical protein
MGLTTASVENKKSKWYRSDEMERIYEAEFNAILYFFIFL